MRDSHQLRGQLIGFDGVYLRDHRNLRSAFDLGCFSGDELVPWSDSLVCWQRDGYQVDVGEGVTYFVVEPLSEQGSRLVQSGRIDEHELTIGSMHDSPHHVPSGLRSTRSDRDFLTGERVDKRRLSRVGATDDGHQPTSKRHSGILTDRRDGGSTATNVRNWSPQRPIEHTNIPSCAELVATPSNCEQMCRWSGRRQWTADG